MSDCHGYPNEIEAALCCPTSFRNPVTTRVTRPRGKPESRTAGRKTPHDWPRVHPGPSNWVVLGALDATVARG